MVETPSTSLSAVSQPHPKKGLLEDLVMRKALNLRGEGKGEGKDKRSICSKA
jgi:hypothetical protein